ncbi:5-formyltetrahydrofolate cyclo-ligase-like isoform X2 [Corticium candelabrum]|nr:5-formyltetrahydrofolate cyclo-ligase-like isoform X2 [Corticium candelabrum]
MDDEVDTEPIVKHILASGRDCFVPRYVGDRMDMLKLYSLDDLSSLPLTKWNIKQPADDDDSRLDAYTAGGLDLVVMPGLGFTIEGDRLGRGKGYYDSYLSLCESRALMPKSIGLAFSAQMCKSIPMGPTDKKIDLVLYPQGTEPGTIENIKHQ